LFPDGIFFVNLAPVHDAALVLPERLADYLRAM
jgi:hypothetical protein